MTDNEGPYKLTAAEVRFQQTVVEKTKQIAETLTRIIPESEPEFVWTVAHDLGDFWEIAEQHRIRVERILKLNGPQARLKLAELLTDLFYGDLKAHLPNHVESMEETLPGLIEKLEADADDV